MLYLIEGMQDVHSKALFEDLEKIEHGTLQIEGICCVIANYRKSAETVDSLAKEIRYNLYLYNDEMVTMSIFRNGWGKERFINKTIVDALMSVEDDLREMQKIVADEENDVVELITKEMEVTVADAMCLAGLRKMIDITTDMVCALVCIMQVTNKYVDIFYDSEKFKKMTGCGEIKCRGLCK